MFALRFVWVMVLVAGVVPDVKTVNEVPVNMWQNAQNRLDNEIPKFEPGRSEPARPRVMFNILWRNCGDLDDPILLKTLDMPDTIDLKSSFNVSADLVLQRTLRSPIKVKMTTQRLFLFWWVTLPCIEHLFGSCSFDDVCAVDPFQNSTCPPIFAEHHIPCACPFPAAEYQVTDVPVDLSVMKIPEAFVSGMYRSKTEISDQNGSRLGCYKTSFNLA